LARFGKNCKCPMSNRYFRFTLLVCDLHQCAANIFWLFENLSLRFSTNSFKTGRTYERRQRVVVA
jgi:hypothetical protein